MNQQFYERQDLDFMQKIGFWGFIGLGSWAQGWALPQPIQDWYEGLGRGIAKVKHHNIYNFDETGFILGQQPGCVCVIGRRRSRVPIPDTRELLSVVECISPDGYALPPYFVFQGKVILERWFSEEHPKDYEVAMAANGFITSPLAFKFLQHFDRHTRNRAGKSKSNRNLDTLKICDTNFDSSLLQ